MCEACAERYNVLRPEPGCRRTRRCGEGGYFSRSPGGNSVKPICPRDQKMSCSTTRPSIVALMSSSSASWAARISANSVSPPPSAEAVEPAAVVAGADVAVDIEIGDVANFGDTEPPPAALQRPASDLQRAEAI